MGVMGSVCGIWWSLYPLYKGVEPLSVLGNAQLPEQLIEVISVNGERLDVLKKPADGGHAPSISSDGWGASFPVTLDP